MASALSLAQQVCLVVLRTLIGWHFLYEGYFKLVLPAWAPDGTRLQAWSSSGYLIVNKTLIEWAAAALVRSFRTGDIAGLDVLRVRKGRPGAHESRTGDADPPVVPAVQRHEDRPCI